MKLLIELLFVVISSYLANSQRIISTGFICGFNLIELNCKPHEFIFITKVQDQNSLYIKSKCNGKSNCAIGIGKSSDKGKICNSNPDNQKKSFVEYICVPYETEPNFDICDRNQDENLLSGLVEKGFISSSYLPNDANKNCTLHIKLPMGARINVFILNLKLSENDTLTFSGPSNVKKQKFFLSADYSYAFTTGRYIDINFKTLRMRSMDRFSSKGFYLYFEINKAVEYTYISTTISSSSTKISTTIEDIVTENIDKDENKLTELNKEQDQEKSTEKPTEPIEVENKQASEVNSNVEETTKALSDAVAKTTGLIKESEIIDPDIKTKDSFEHVVETTKIISDPELQKTTASIVDEIKEAGNDKLTENSQIISSTQAPEIDLEKTETEANQSLFPIIEIKSIESDTPNSEIHQISTPSNEEDKVVEPALNKTDEEIREIDVHQSTINPERTHTDTIEVTHLPIIESEVKITQAIETQEKSNANDAIVEEHSSEIKQISNINKLDDITEAIEAEGNKDDTKHTTAELDKQSSEVTTEINDNEDIDDYENDTDNALNIGEALSTAIPDGEKLDQEPIRDSVKQDEEKTTTTQPKVTVKFTSRLHLRNTTKVLIDDEHLLDNHKETQEYKRYLKIAGIVGSLLCFVFVMYFLYQFGKRFIRKQRGYRQGNQEEQYQDIDSERTALRS